MRKQVSKERTGAGRSKAYKHYLKHNTEILASPCLGCFGCVIEGYYTAKGEDALLRGGILFDRNLFLRSYENWWDINIWTFVVSAHSSHIYRPGFRLWHWHTQVVCMTEDTPAAPHSSPAVRVERILPLSYRQTQGSGRQHRSSPTENKTNGSWGNLPVQHTSLSAPSPPDHRLEHVTQILANHNIPFPWPQPLVQGKAHDPNWANQSASLGFFQLEMAESPSFLFDHEAVGRWAWSCLSSWSLNQENLQTQETGGRKESTKALSLWFQSPPGPEASPPSLSGGSANQ